MKSYEILIFFSKFSRKEEEEVMVDEEEEVKPSGIGKPI